MITPSAGSYSEVCAKVGPFLGCTVMWASAMKIATVGLYQLRFDVCELRSRWLSMVGFLCSHLLCPTSFRTEKSDRPALLGEGLTHKGTQKLDPAAWSVSPAQTSCEWAL